MAHSDDLCVAVLSKCMVRGTLLATCNPPYRLHASFRTVNTFLLGLGLGESSLTGQGAVEKPAVPPPPQSITLKNHLIGS